MKKTIILISMILSSWAQAEEINFSRGFCQGIFTVSNVKDFVVIVDNHRLFYRNYNTYFFVVSDNEFFSETGSEELRGYNWPNTHIRLTKRQNGLVDFEYTAPFEPFVHKDLLYCVQKDDEELDQVIHDFITPPFGEKP